MKNTLYLTMSLAALGFTFVTSNPLRADDEKTTTVTNTSTVTSQGTIADYSPDAFTVRTSSSAMPVRYFSSKTTTYVDENGAPVSVETVKSGLPVTVYYDQEGDRMVASKVIVRRATIAPAPTTVERSSTTTTTKKSDDD